ncbi:MAG TPA: nicotinate (nicotinamide) nucleotide adenylyltransferase [Anaeromyxobacteraceae bacterium]|nr:nicotinate (nicotinamide) nucleotide adenylyltransferase [Anaeromyxobacteraceae bacterium]
MNPEEERPAGPGEAREETKAPREVALLGGSFNPPHVAHLMAAYWALATQGVKEVWLLPSYRHPFGKELAPYEDRVRMCELAAAPLRGVHVCRAEEELASDPLVGKTVRTLEYLRDKHPALRFALVVGADVLGEAARWYRFDQVRELARLIVVGREGHPPASGQEFALPDVSSTAIRARLAGGEDVSRLVPARVLGYLQARGLYRGKL